MNWRANLHQNYTPGVLVLFSCVVWDFSKSARVWGGRLGGPRGQPLLHHARGHYHPGPNRLPVFKILLYVLEAPSVARLDIRACGWWSSP